MVSRGWSGRTEDPIDRRHKRIAITSAGPRPDRGDAGSARAREFTRVLSSLTSEVQAQFGKVLARVVTELKACLTGMRSAEIVGKELQKREALDADAKRNKATRS